MQFFTRKKDVVEAYTSVSPVPTLRGGSNPSSRNSWSISSRIVDFRDSSSAEILRHPEFKSHLLCLHLFFAHQAIPARERQDRRKVRSVVSQG